ncbi:hypothetical protein A4X09_0g7748 [Tilletia walkeri]|uniref:Uncharacterized protein n=1 Tax=Tilletia walkeri TaxID=117179 RepID=A0A8X7N1B6_9BASI|nr:hypothetical protein A4X09_0g7748 [Tilletia walkeri]
MALASPAASTRPSTPSSPLGRPYGEVVRDLSLRTAASRRHDHPVPATCFSITSPPSIASTAALPRSSPSFDSPLPWSPASDTPLSLSVSVASPLAPVTRVSNSTALSATPAPNIKGEPAPTIRSANASDRWRLEDMTICPSTASTSAAVRAAINSDVSRERVHMDSLDLAIERLRKAWMVARGNLLLISGRSATADLSLQRVHAAWIQARQWCMARPCTSLKVAPPYPANRLTRTMLFPPTPNRRILRSAVPRRLRTSYAALAPFRHNSARISRLYCTSPSTLVLPSSSHPGFSGDAIPGRRTLSQHSRPTAI